MIPRFAYQIPSTLEEACDLLWNSDGRAKVIAGGTDLVIGLRSGGLKPDLLIDVTRLSELQGIRDEGGVISIGAGVTHAELAGAALIQRNAKALSEAASVIGSPQIRNLGTLGGNIVNASPAADTLPALMILNAFGEVVSKNGQRKVPLTELFTGPYETALKPSEILTRITIEILHPDTRWGFTRLARREAMAIARLSVAVAVRMRKGDSVLEDVRISVGAMTPIPQRFVEAEAFLRGQSPGSDLFKGASRKISGEILHVTGRRESSSYKIPVAEALFIRALERAMGEGAMPPPHPLPNPPLEGAGA
jgi:CO/xanthine dehydrogenase FAD-binding subunit